MSSDESPKPKRTHKTRGPALSLREVRFCIGYAEHGNLTRAHTEAGFEAASENAHAVAGRKLLRKGKIRQYIRALQTEALTAAQVTANRIVQGLARIAFADRGDLFDGRGCLLPKDQWPADVAGAVEAVETEEVTATVFEKGQPPRREVVGHVRKVKTAGRVAALKLLAEWKRMIGPDVPALEVLLNALPPDVAGVVREALARAVLARGDPGGTGGG